MAVEQLRDAAEVVGEVERVDRDEARLPMAREDALEFRDQRLEARRALLVQRPVPRAPQLVFSVRRVVERCGLRDVDEDGNPGATGLVPQRIESRIVDEVRPLTR